MSHGDLTDCEGEPDGGILAWATWSRLYGFATRRRNLLGQTGENGVWVPARRLMMVLFASAWLPAGTYASYTYLGVQYVPPVFLDELERFGREAAAQGVVKFNRHMPNGSEKFGWRLVPGVVAEVITLNARCADLTVVSLANRNESARRGSAELSASFAPSASRSVLAVPHIGAHKTPGQYITAAWNAGRDATQSIGDATPILERPAVTRSLDGRSEGEMLVVETPRRPRGRTSRAELPARGPGRFRRERIALAQCPPPSLRHNGPGQGGRSRDATDKAHCRRRSYGRSRAWLHNAIGPHSSLGYRPPAPETIIAPSWPPGSATLRRPPSLAEKPAMH